MGHALRKLNTALEINRRVNGPEHIDNVRIMNKMGEAYDKQGNYTEALRAYNAALEINRKVNGQEHIDNVRIMYKMGAIHSKLGPKPGHTRNYNEALRVLNEALEINRKVNGPEHIDNVRIMIKIGEAYQQRVVVIKDGRLLTLNVCPALMSRNVATTLRRCGCIMRRLRLIGK